MRENVLDVLMYLFETYMDNDIEEEPDHNEMRDELEQAGFGDLEIDRALEWLDGLTSGQEAWRKPRLAKRRYTSIPWRNGAD